MRHQNDQEDQLLYRLSTGTLGAMIGAVVSLIMLAISSWLSVPTYTYGHAMLAGAIAGGAIGAIAPSIVMPALLGLIYFLFGFFAMFAPSVPKIERPQGGGRFFWVVFIFGVLFYFLLWTLPGGSVHAHAR